MQCNAMQPTVKSTFKLAQNQSGLKTSESHFSGKNIFTRKLTWSKNITSRFAISHIVVQPCLCAKKNKRNYILLSYTATSKSKSSSKVDQNHLLRKSSRLGEVVATSQRLTYQPGSVNCPCRAAKTIHVSAHRLRPSHANGINWRPQHISKCHVTCFSGLTAETCFLT